jgi:putative transposase
MIDRSDPLPVVQPCAWLGRSRASVYDTPQPVSESDLALMRRIDERHLNPPFAGARRLRDRLGQDGLKIGRRQVSTLMKKRGIEALYRRPNTRRKHPQNPVFPYRLRGLEIKEANPVWAMDISVPQQAA